MTATDMAFGRDLAGSATDLSEQADNSGVTATGFEFVPISLDESAATDEDNGRWLSLEDLQVRNACADQVVVFQALRLADQPITEAVCLHCADQFDWRWCAKNLLTPSLLAEYERTVAPAKAEFERATVPAQLEYERAIAPLKAAYKRGIAPFYAEYERAIAPASAVYKEAIAPFAAACERSQAPDWEACGRATAPALAAYERAIAPAKAIYKHKIAPIRERYEKVTRLIAAAHKLATAPARSPYDRAQVIAFYRLWSSQV